MNSKDYLTSIAKEQFWHLCTPGDSSGIIFRVKEDYIYGMNMVGVSAAKFFSSIDIYTFQLMSNHLHFVIRGENNDVEMFYQDLLQRLRRYLLKETRVYDIQKISHSILAVNDIGYLRNLIAYVNRNGYLVNKFVTPFTYPWGANRYSSIAREIGDTISYTDEELFVAAIHYIHKEYDKQNIQALTKTEKIEVAKKLHFEYNASNKQIGRILKLDLVVLNALFPNR